MRKALKSCSHSGGQMLVIEALERAFQRIIHVSQDVERLTELALLLVLA